VTASVRRPRGEEGGAEPARTFSLNLPLVCGNFVEKFEFFVGMLQLFALFIFNIRRIWRMARRRVAETGRFCQLYKNLRNSVEMSAVLLFKLAVNVVGLIYEVDQLVG